MTQFYLLVVVHRLQLYQVHPATKYTILANVSPSNILQEIVHSFDTFCWIFVHMISIALRYIQSLKDNDMLHI